MLTHAHVRNFRVLEDVAFPLTHLTVLHGPSASGKSTALDALHRIAVQGGHASSLRTRGEAHRGEPVSVRVAVQGSPAEAVEFVWHDTGRAVRVHGEGLDHLVWGEHDRVVELLGSAPLRLDPARLADAAPTFGHGRLEPDGYGLALAVARRVETDPLLMTRLTNLIEPAAPLWIGPQLVHAGGKPELALFHPRHGAVPQGDLAAGLLRLTALALLEFLPLGPVTLLDEPELGLDEAWLPFVAERLARAVAAGDAPRQLVVTTRSATLAQALAAHGASVVRTRDTEQGVRFDTAPTAVAPGALRPDVEPRPTPPTSPGPAA